MLKSLALSGVVAILFMGTGWFYKETIFQFMYNIEAIKQNTLDEVVLTVGDPKVNAPRWCTFPRGTQ